MVYRNLKYLTPNNNKKQEKEKEEENKRKERKREKANWYLEDGRESESRLTTTGVTAGGEERRTVKTNERLCLASEYGRSDCRAGLYKQ